MKGLTKKEIDLLVLYILPDYIEALQEKSKRGIVEIEQRVVASKKPSGSNELLMAELQNPIQISSQVSQFSTNVIKTMNESAKAVIANICSEDCDAPLGKTKPLEYYLCEAGKQRPVHQRVSPIRVSPVARYYNGALHTTLGSGCCG